MVITPDEARLTTPPDVANEVAPVESNVETDVSPVTSKVESKVTASSTFNVPFTVVITPDEARLTILVAVIFDVNVFSPATDWSPVVRTALSSLDLSPSVNAPSDGGCCALSAKAPCAEVAKAVASCKAVSALAPCAAVA